MPTMTQNTYTNVASQNQLTAENAEFYHRTLLDRLKGQLMITKYAQKSLSAPKNAGAQISYRRFGNLAVTKTALVEGVTPDAITASVTKITSTVKQYGAYLVTTDFLQTVGLDPIITELSEVLGDQAAETIEGITVDTLAAGTNVRYAGGKTSRATLTASDVFNADMLLTLSTQLKDAKVKPIKLPDGTSGYIAFLHTKQAYDLKKDTKWIEANKYVDTKNIINGCIGKYMNVFVVEYDFAPVLAGAGASGATVYQAVCFGENAFGMPDIEGSAKPEMIVKVPTGANDNTTDPLNQRSTIAQHLHVA